MTTGAKRVTGARQAAFTALLAVQEQGAYANLTLKQVLPTLPPQQRPLTAQLVYGTLENQRWLDYAIDQKLKKPNLPTAVRVALRMGAYQLFFLKTPDYAAVNDAVALVSQNGHAHHKGLVNAVLRGLARDGQTPALPPREKDEATYLSIRHNWPRWVVRTLQKQLGKEDAEAFLSHQGATDTIPLRPNPLHVQFDLQAWLTENAAQWQPGHLVKSMALVSGLGDAASLPQYCEGDFSIQGEAARYAAAAVMAKPGMRILDACAAPGGKTCAMAEDADDQAQILAWDIHPHRVELIQNSAKRLGISSIDARQWDAAQPKPGLENTMDAVLLDVPCSALGVTQGKPEIRLTATWEGAQQIAQTQAAILDACCRYVKPGGALIYATCTVLTQENALQVQNFLQTHTDFMPDPAHEAGQGRVFWPHKDNTEGFFVARLIRKNPPMEEA